MHFDCESRYYERRGDMTANQTVQYEVGKEELKNILQRLSALPYKMESQTKHIVVIVTQVKFNDDQNR